MRTIIILISCVTTFFSCKKEEQTSICQLKKFVTYYPTSNLIHHDLITLKDGRIEKMYSYDLRNAKDSANRLRIAFEYNAMAKLTALRDETNPNRISRFDLVYDASGLVTKSVQTVNGLLNEEIIIEYDKQKRPISAIGARLISANRTIEYDENGNPFRVYRSDNGTLPTVNEHTFDTNRNFFEGIPELKIYWLIRPLYSFMPFGANNVKSTKFYSLQNNEFKEVPENRAIRETTVNEQGFPISMKIILENQNRLVASESSFEYDCK
jgi:hypothetical protein